MELEGYEAAVFDLDGTLAVLDVDWPALRGELASLLEDHGVDASDVEPGVWDLLERAERADLGDEAHDAIRRRELAGGESAAALPLADRVPPLADAGVRVGICSLNSTEAVEVALATIGIADHVDAALGRELGRPRKPDPVPLLDVIDALGARRDETVFVGDSASDEETADAAGVAFRYAAELDDGYPDDWAAVEWRDGASAQDLVDETYGEGG